MYINITDSETADNKGSSSGLVHYLDKENRLDPERQPEYWFNQERVDILSGEVMPVLDRNIAKLSKTDAKFFLVNISPSQKEISFLKARFGEEGAKAQLKTYAVSVLDEYARNFKRPGIESSKDLLWFGKLENHRYYSHKDPEVKQGLRKRGERKEGDQLHIQVIVSRKDITNSIKLSPMNKSRGRNTAHSQRMGQFDRSAFKASGEILFDRAVGFERGLTETFQYANTQKKGSLEERLAMYTEKHKLEIRQQLRSAASRQPMLVREKESDKTYAETPAVTGFLAAALARTQTEPGTAMPRKRKKRMKRGLYTGPELTL